MLGSITLLGKYNWYTRISLNKSGLKVINKVNYFRLSFSPHTQCLIRTLRFASINKMDAADINNSSYLQQFGLYMTKKEYNMDI